MTGFILRINYFNKRTINFHGDEIMRYDDELLERIFDKTSGKCHICWKKISYSNFGSNGKRGAWEIEHSVPKSLGGTDNLNNLFPAHIYCNRHKSNKSTRVARAEHGHTRAPYSKERLRRIKKDNSFTGGIAGLAIAAVLETNPAGLIFLTIAGAMFGHIMGPED